MGCCRPGWQAQRPHRSPNPCKFIAAPLYIARMGLSFRRLQIDVIWRGGAMLLQFVALIVLASRACRGPSAFLVACWVFGPGSAADGLLTWRCGLGARVAMEQGPGHDADQPRIAAVGPVFYAVQRLWRFMSVATRRARRSPGSVDELVSLPPQNLHHHAATAATAAAVSSSVIAGLHQPPPAGRARGSARRYGTSNFARRGAWCRPLGGMLTRDTLAGGIL